MKKFFLLLFRSAGRHPKIPAVSSFPMTSGYGSESLSEQNAAAQSLLKFKLKKKESRRYRNSENGRGDWI